MSKINTKKTLGHVKALISDIEDNWVMDKCKGYAVGCPNCQGQILLGMLDDYKALLEYELTNQKEA